MFTASWCPPCRHIMPYFTEIAIATSIKDVRFVSVDIDQNKVQIKLNKIRSFKLY